MTVKKPKHKTKKPTEPNEHKHRHRLHEILQREQEEYTADVTFADATDDVRLRMIWSRLKALEAVIEVAVKLR